MTMQAPPHRESVVARARRLVRGELGRPALRGSYALLVTTALTAALGLAFWVASARLLPVEVLGVGSATVATIMTAANLGQLNLYQTAGVLLADDRTRRSMALRLFLVATAATVLIGTGAAVLISATGWIADLAVPPVIFVLCAVAWTWYSLKDAVLVGIRRFAAVPIANTTYGLLKLAAIVLLAAVIPWQSIVVATFLPAALIVPFVALFIVRALRSDPPGSAPARIDIRFIGGDYIGFVLLQLSTTLLPFIVLLAAGPRAAGVFSAVWMIVVMLDVLAHNAGVPLASEAARDPQNAIPVDRAVRRRALLLVTAAAVPAALLAYPVLSLFGPEFTDVGVLPLQLMLVASIPRAGVVLTFAWWRSQRKVALIAVCEAAHSIFVIGAFVLLLPLLGLPAIGVAWLGAQVTLAIVCAIIRARGRKAS